MELKDAELKAAARKAMSERRGGLDPAVASRRSRLAQEFVLLSPIWRTARSVGLYMAIKGETSAEALLSAALGAGKAVYLPKVTGPRTMQFHLCASRADLMPGVWDILEPPANGIQPQRLDLIIIPGLAFDRTGTRLGYGGGYYDRYLQSQPCIAAKTLGLCFGFQILPRLPHAAWDVPVDGLCSEEGLEWL